MPTSPKRINVHNDRFAPQSTDLNKNQDSVIFVKVGDKVPGTLTVDAGLFSTTTCTIGADASSAPAYTPLATASGSYGISVDVPSTKATIVSGTIRVNG